MKCIENLPYFAEENFALKQANTSFEMRIVKLEVQMEKLQSISWDKDALIEKYEVKSKEGECVSTLDKTSVTFCTLFTPRNGC